MIRNLILFSIVFVAFATGCQSPSSSIPLVLNRSTFTDIDEIDTIEAFPEKQLYFLKLTRRGHLGDYTITYGIEKQIGNKATDKLRYEADDRGLRSIPAQHELWFWYDKDYFLLMDREISDYGHGWIRMKGGKKLGWDIVGNRTSEVRDSFQKMDTANYRSFADGTSKMAKIYRNDKLVYQIPFDSLTAKYEEENFRNLAVGLYKRINDSLVMVSKEPNDIMKSEDGIYFVPIPGYGVRSKYRKNEIFQLIDSVSKTASPPNKLVINPIK